MTSAAARQAFDYRALAADLGVVVRADEPLAPHTWLKVGGPVPFLFLPDSIEQAARLFGELRRGPLPVRILGAGSNLVVADEGLAAVVVATREIDADPQPLDPTSVFAPCGAAVPGLARWAQRQGLAGLEFAEGIPAQLGGALRMNAGAHGSSFSAVVAALAYADDDGVVRRHAVGDGDFAYRESIVHRRGWMALGATLRLAQEDPRQVMERMLEYRRRRRETQPVTERSAGCVFANYPGQPVGRLVEELGLKGTRIGGAEVSPLHGNFIVNTGGATAADVVALIDLVAARLAGATGVEPRREVEIWRD